MPKLQDAKEFIGKKYGLVTIMEDRGIHKGIRHVWGQCDCGIERRFNLKSLKEGNTKSCGCLHKNNPNDYIGKVYNKCKIISDAGINNGRTIVLFQCECGNIKKTLLKNLKNGNVKSCGCIYLKRNGKSAHPLYITWSNMNDRCRNEKSTYFKRYGGNGVKVSTRWQHDFQAFYDWAIKRWKPGLELDKDILSSTGNGKLYCPELCCFVSSKENCRKRVSNVTVFHKGESKCLTEWCEIYGLNYWAIRSRIRRGWNPEIALTKPLRKSCQ